MKKPVGRPRGTTRRSTVLIGKEARLWRLTKLPKVPEDQRRGSMIAAHAEIAERFSGRPGWKDIQRVKKYEQRYGDRLRMQVLMVDESYRVEGWDGIEFLELDRWEWEGGFVTL